MSSLVDHPDATFSTDFEPQELRRRHCDDCGWAVAVEKCEQCKRFYCAACELQVHHRLEPLALKHEESKGDGRPHQEFLSRVNVCQECKQKSAEFWCMDCQTYQCENCCAVKHVRLQPNSGHYYFCVEGSSVGMLRYAICSTDFLGMVRTSQRELLDRSRPAPIPMPSSTDISSGFLTTPQTVPAAWVKEEQTPVQSSATEATLGNLQELSISETSRADAEQPPPPPGNGAEQTKRTPGATMVDLTLDDDEVEMLSRSSPAVPQVPPRVKQEPHVKAESAWLESAASAPSQSVLDVDELMEKALGEDDDPLLRTMVGQYNHLSVQIYNTDQEVAKIRDRVKELRNAQPMNMAEVQKAHQGVAQLRPVLTKFMQDRDEAVAQIVVYLKSDPQELKAFLDQCTVDVPYAQVACHHKCAAMEASIRAKLAMVQQLQRGMEDAMGMKKENAFAEVMRLGAEIAAGETEVRKLDQDRLNEFTTLCQFSSQIQQAVRTKSAQNS